MCPVILAVQAFRGPSGAAEKELDKEALLYQVWRVLAGISSRWYSAEGALDPFGGS